MTAAHITPIGPSVFAFHTCPHCDGTGRTTYEQRVRFNHSLVNRICQTCDGDGTLVENVVDPERSPSVACQPSSSLYVKR